jgi:hypothetical protein
MAFCISENFRVLNKQVSKQESNLHSREVINNPHILYDKDENLNTQQDGSSVLIAIFNHFKNFLTLEMIVDYGDKRI